MQQRTQTRIQIPSQATPGSIYRQATVTGPAEGCQKIQEIIARISGEQSSQFVMTGEAFQQGGHGGGQAYGGQYGQQQQQQQQYGAASGQEGGDYSAQWAAYYAAQAAQGGAAGQQAAAPAAAQAVASTAGAAATGQAGASDQYYEDFFRYEYYYGESAARERYGAWSPAVGTPNPYGVNPDLAKGTAAAAPVQAPAPAPAAAPAAAAPNRGETSVRRGVSNLPAWMTKG